MKLGKRERSEDSMLCGSEIEEFQGSEQSSWYTELVPYLQSEVVLSRTS